MRSVPAVGAVVVVLIGMPRVSSSIRSAAPVAVAATTSRSAWAIASRISRRRTFFTALNMAAVAWRTATKSGWVSSSPAMPSSTLRVASRSAGSMPLGGRSGVAGVSGGTRDSTSAYMRATCYRATVTSANADETPPRRIHVSAAVIHDGDGRLLVVRKSGTTAFMQPGGKPEPGETPSETLSRELAEELGIRIDPDELRALGSFTAAAANEPGFVVVADVFAADIGSQSPVVGAEIAELRWVTRADADRFEIAPLASEYFLPDGPTRASSRG